MLATDWVAGSQVVIGVPANQQRAGFMCPFFVSKAVEVITQIPGDIGEGR